jgi:hypothetical protein
MNPLLAGQSVQCGEVSVIAATVVSTLHKLDDLSPLRLDKLGVRSL